MLYLIAYFELFHFVENCDIFVDKNLALIYKLLTAVVKIVDFDNVN